MNVSDHARGRMLKRGITMDDVEHAINHTLGAPAPGDNGNVVITGQRGARRLAVVLTPDRGTLVTAYWRD
jgi:hypothetical protein